MQNTQAKNTSNTSDVYLLKGVDQGQPAWYYVRFDSKTKFMMFQARCKHANDSNLDIQDYGSVVCSGWGDTPPEAVQHTFKENAA